MDSTMPSTAPCTRTNETGAAVKTLKWDEPQKVQYAIPLWLRDEQIKLAIERVEGRIPGRDPSDVRSERIAVACYGPSLADTWEQLRDFQYVISCSGAHRFLIDRGIIPTWHVEVDPRAHKAILIGQPHPEVVYLPASTCHPAYFDHLETGLGKDVFREHVLLWHIFDSQEEALRTLPAGEWALTGGSSVGLRAMTIARFFGFRELHVFGMDGCEGATGKHAAAHPNQPPGHSLVDYGGVTYRTTPSMLECARGTWHELDQMKDVAATFHGDGLVQAMAKDYVRKPPKGGEAVLAMHKPELITEEYLDLNRRLHHDNLAYGVGGGKHAPTVLKLADNGTRSVLDYGCGKGYLAKAISFPIWEYDPAIPGKDVSPRPADVVCCFDVLEHVEPEKILFVLDDLRRVTRRVGYFVIHTGPSKKALADGRNAHILQRDKSWWRKMLGSFFQVGTLIEKGQLLHVVVAPKGNAPTKAKLAKATVPEMGKPEKALKWDKETAPATVPTPWPGGPRPY